MNRLRWLSIILLFSANVYADPGILSRPDVATAIENIHTDTFTKRIPVECAALIFQDHVEFVSGSREEIRFQWQTGIQAVVHTHPDRGYERPSRQDLETAMEHHVIIYVVSDHQVWEALPSGEVNFVK